MSVSWIDRLRMNESDNDIEIRPIKKNRRPDCFRCADILFKMILFKCKKSILLVALYFLYPNARLIIQRYPAIHQLHSYKLVVADKQIAIQVGKIHLRGELRCS